MSDNQVPVTQLSLDEYQKRAADTKVYHTSPTIDGLTYAVLALCGEAGELANKLKKVHRAGRRVSMTDRLVLADELGDVQWYVAAVASELGFFLSQIGELNLDKLKLRAAENKVSDGR
jgi:NTP pyrophosphatase (non-canonical NTP hydrolase)